MKKSVIAGWVLCVVLAGSTVFAEDPEWYGPSAREEYAVEVVDSGTIARYDQLLKDCLRNKDYDCARVNIQTIVELQPSCNTFYALGVVNYWLDDYQAALGSFQQAKGYGDKCNDDLLPAVVDLAIGVTLKKLGQLEEAEQTMDAALSAMELDEQWDEVFLLRALMEH